MSEIKPKLVEKPPDNQSQLNQPFCKISEDGSQFDLYGNLINSDVDINCQLDENNNSLHDVSDNPRDGPKRNESDNNKLGTLSIDESIGKSNLEEISGLNKYQETQECLNDQFKRIKTYGDIKKSLSERSHSSLPPSFNRVDDDYSAFMSEELDKKISNQVNFQNTKNMGWVLNNGRFDFIHGGGSLDPNSNIRGRPEFVLVKRPDVSERISFRHMIEMLNIADYSMTLPVFLYTLLSLLNRLFRLAKFEPRHVLWVWGSSGAYKSTICHMFSQIYNTHLEDEVALSTIDTLTAITTYIESCDSYVAMVDDFFVPGTRAEFARFTQMKNRLTRIVGERHSRKRSHVKQGEDKLSVMKAERPDVGLICTAEDRQTSIESEDARLTIVHFEKHKILKSKSEIRALQLTRTIYSTGIHFFLEYVSERALDIIDQISDSALKYRELVSKKVTGLYNSSEDLFNHDRYGDNFSTMMIINDIFADYMRDRQLADENYITQYINKSTNVLYELFKVNSDEILEKKPAIMFLIALKEMLDKGELKIKDINYSGPSFDRFVGFYDESNYYIFPSVYQSIQSYYRREGKEYSLSKQKLYADLAKHQVIFVKPETREGRNTIVKTHGYKIGSIDYKRYLVINRKKMADLVGMIL